MSETDTIAKRNKFRLAFELFMLTLLLINLHLIIFDWLFQSDSIRIWLQSVLPAFHDWYNLNIHQDFLRIDMIFVSFYLVEFFAQWVYAVIRQSYRRWYYYPILHWYDILGCIPVSTMRFIRLVRVFSIVGRLHRLGWIDITKNPIFDQFARFMNIVVDEVTDRVVLRLLNNVRDEVNAGTPVIDQIITDVVQPRREQLVNWLSYRVKHMTEYNFASHREDLRNYVNQKIEEAVTDNKELQKLEALPFVGPYTARMIERATSDIVFKVIDGIIRDLGSEANREIIKEITDITFDDLLGDDESSPLNRVISDVIVQSMDIIINKVRAQEWKYADIERHEEVLKEKLRIGLDEAVE